MSSRFMAPARLGKLRNRLAMSVASAVVALACVGATVPLAHADSHAPTYFDGLDAMRAGDPTEAYGIWKQLADEGDNASQYSLALLLETGQGAVDADIESALTYYMRAADGGVPEAQTNLGLLYAEGRGVVRNPELAVEYWKKSAGSGHAMGLFNLGLAFYQGTGTEKNQSEATGLIFEAASLGQAEAQFAMGQFYRFGLGVEKSEPEALYWYSLAAEQGHAQATQFSTDLAGQGIVASVDPTPSMRPEPPSVIQIAALAPAVEEIDPEPRQSQATDREPVIAQKPVAPMLDDQPMADDVMASDSEMAAMDKALDQDTGFDVVVEDTQATMKAIEASVEDLETRVIRLNIDNNIPVDVQFLTETEAENSFREALVLFQNPDGDRIVNGQRAVMKLFNAAISGNAKAQRSLGELYLLGLDVSRSDSQALYWLRLAEANGIADINGFADILELRGVSAPARPAPTPFFANGS